MKNILYKCLLVATMGFSLCGQANADLMVIAHPFSNAQPLKEKEVKALFLNKKVKGFKGGKVKLILPPLDSDAGKEFLDRVVNMTPSRFQSHWSSQIFTGKGLEPLYVKTLEETVATLEADVAFVAVIDSMTIPKNTKLLYRLVPEKTKNTVAQLERLQALRDAGALTQQEYQSAKKRVLATP